MIELRGVLSSCAIDEKNMALIFEEVRSSSLILVMSEQIAIIYCPPLTHRTLTIIYRLGFLALKTFSIWSSLVDDSLGSLYGTPSWLAKLIKYYQRFLFCLC